MKYLTRAELVDRIRSVFPHTPVNTIHSYIQMGVIKPTRVVKTGTVRHTAEFSEEYVDQILKCGEPKNVINWDEVKKITNY